ncbi:putative Oxygen-independent coproporphyrinogen III oxidase [Nitrospira sp. KM1]|uniref:radical SAM family heme chaperone HemW n=1 Tax=Nitrospira sp. KM1 TaxID=1936990 RepID=UPI0013A73C8F|nr:radical SAM family heme chaperone HemW [Nitrospira sp. KM1]BCA53300.1 putative Oxygen-independent coproporphyrinogen III oxidase [Nitrospira sp. KM1]
MIHPVGLYIHIPFCRQRCDFCAFYLEIHREQAAAAFLNALKKEMAIHADGERLGGRILQSVYVGGGTPTVLSCGQLTAILEEVRKRFILEPMCEITVEAHPGTVTRDYLLGLADAGVTRVSFGAESMENDELRAVGRPGDESQTVRAVIHAYKAGIMNVNLDLMFGLPGQTVESWRSSLRGCLDTGASHLSCYALTIEAGTPLARQVRMNLAKVADEPLQIAMEELAQSILEDHGFERYEISNYARPDFACRHNLLYWTGGDYLGLGPSAQSLVDGVRFGNVADLGKYGQVLRDGVLPIEEECRLSLEEQHRDRVIFGLRLLRGVATEGLYRHVSNYGYAHVMRELYDRRLLEDTPLGTRLTRFGRLQADGIAEMLY